MSFSGNIKAFISSVPPENDCCKMAELRAMLSYSAYFDGDMMRFITESAETADMLTSLLLVIADITATPEEKTSADITTYKTEITNKNDIKKLVDICGGIDNIHRINEKEFTCPECANAYIRGAFLAAGFANSPDHSYHIEISTPFADLAIDTAVILSKKIGMPKISARKSNQILYYRESSLVEDFLTFIGASKFAMEIMNEQIKREMRNKANRQSNFEVANIEKTIEAANAQIEAINELRESGKFDEMPEKMKEAALLRVENYDMTQKELGEKFSPPISKSQVSKLLSKVTNFHKTWKDEK